MSVGPAETTNDIQPGRQQRPETRPPGERGHRARVAPTTPTASDHPPCGNVSGSAVRDRDPPICDYFQKVGRVFGSPEKITVTEPTKKSSEGTLNLNSVACDEHLGS